MGTEPRPPLVSASTGVMESLRAKLNMAITSESSSLKEGLRLLKENLGSMDALLRKFAGRDDPDVQITEWMRQIRELAYDAEDCIDLYTHQQQHESKGFFPWGNRKPDFAKRIKALTTRISEANKRCTEYQLRGDNSAAPPSMQGRARSFARHNSVTIDPQLLNHGSQGGRLEGLHKLPPELLPPLDGEQDKSLKVLSVVGVGGIGKTTLAMQLSRTLQARFDCRAFVTVGRNPPMRTTLLRILRQVTRQQHADDMDEQRVIEDIRKFLSNKRYLVILDDLWSLAAWKIIKCALPDSNRGNRIIVTTRSNEVANSCSSRSLVHVMTSLSESDADLLFRSKLPSCPREMYDGCNLKEVLSNVLKACGGVPLAIVAVAGLLSWKFSELVDWNIAKNEVVSALEKHTALQGMRRVLHVCYSDLSVPVKTCFLYLSCFPENHTIRKDRLIWRWVAEGFIAPGTGEDAPWCKGEDYFNELVNRRLIQPQQVVVTSMDDDGDDPMGCTVHDLVLDFVVSTSIEENFVTSDAGVQSLPRDVIRRLSLNCSGQDDHGGLAAESRDMSLSQVRSLTVFGAADWLMPLLDKFHLLRVLDLQETEKLTNDHLNHVIDKLFRLKYLALGGAGVTKLPEKIGDQLQDLETLDVRRTAVKELPASTVRLRRLARLLVHDLPMQEGLEKMNTLHEVRMIRVTEGSATLPKRLAELARLNKNLKILGVNWCVGNASRDREGGAGIEFAKSFQASLENIGKSPALECLLLHAGDASQTSLNAMVDDWNPPYLLQRFVMTSSGYCFPKVPPNMAMHGNLTQMTISIVRLSVQDLQLLSALPSLIVLKLRTRESTTPTTIAGDGFQCLQVFCFKSNDSGLGLVFTVGAMPKLYELRLSFMAGAEVNSVGINHLSSLRNLQVELQAIVNHPDASATTIKNTEDAIKEQVSKIKSKPAVEFIVDELMQKQDANTQQVAQHS